MSDSIQTHAQVSESSVLVEERVELGGVGVRGVGDCKEAKDSGALDVRLRLEPVEGSAVERLDLSLCAVGRSRHTNLGEPDVLGGEGGVDFLDVFLEACGVVPGLCKEGRDDQLVREEREERSRRTPYQWIAIKSGTRLY